MPLLNIFLAQWTISILQTGELKQKKGKYGHNFSFRIKQYAVHKEFNYMLINSKHFKLNT